jgi:hypothetical protein
MNNYCGFIEIWRGSKYVNQSHCPLPFDSLKQQTDHAEKVGLKTIAIFKIKIK